MTSKWNAENMADQSGKVAVVTGANSGIGYEMARELAIFLLKNRVNPKLEY